MTVKPVFVTGNMNKVADLSNWLGFELNHHKLDLDELQELDPYVVVDHKAKQAYQILNVPVLVEDISLDFIALGRLPGTYIKWFLEELKTKGCCKLLDGFTDRSAQSRVIYAYFDGKDMQIFDAVVKGSVPDSPRGGNGFGWDSIFVPDGSDMTYAELNQAENNENYSHLSVRNQAVKKLKIFLDKS